MGILFAFIALFSWGLGDFLIQKSARKFGDWLALFYIAAFSTLALFPFIYKDLGAIFSDLKSLAFLIFDSVVILFAALFDFEAFKRGKIAVIEPVNAMDSGCCYNFKFCLVALSLSDFISVYYIT